MASISLTAEGARTATVVVGEDQLSLAIGRDGQNARLAAKLTGWRIDIKSLSEASGDSLKKLQGNAELAAMLPAAVEAIPQIVGNSCEEGREPPDHAGRIYCAQSICRPCGTPHHSDQGRSRPRGGRTHHCITVARADIPAAAFTMPLDQAGIKEHIFNILTEAGFETVGNLMFALKTDANKVLGLAGIGSKAMQNIEESLAAIQFPEPVQVEEPVVAESCCRICFSDRTAG